MESGKVVAVMERATGSAMVGDHATGVTEVVVDDIYPFSESGGLLTIGADEYTYLPWTEDDSPLTLTSPLLFDGEDGDPVLLSPLSLTKYATVVLGADDELEPGDAIEATIKHSLYDKFAEGVREDDACETVVIIATDDGYVVDDIIGRPPVVDASFIDPDTMPPAPPIIPTDPPGGAPVLTASPFSIGALLLSWTKVTGAQWYDVYASLTSGFDSDDVGNRVLTGITGLQASVAAIGGVQIPMDGTPIYVVVKAVNVAGSGPASNEASGTARQADAEFLSALYAWFGTVEAQTAILGSLNVVMNVDIDGVISIGDRITIADPNAPDGKGGITIWGDDAHTIILARLHPDGNYLDGILVAQDITVIQALRLIGSASAIASGARLKIENGVADPAAPALASSPALTNWPAIPTGYTERGICWETTNSQWWQLLWRTSNNRAYIRTISTAGIASTVTTLALPAAGVTVLSVNTIAWSPTDGRILVGTSWNNAGDVYRGMAIHNPTTGALILERDDSLLPSGVPIVAADDTYYYFGYIYDGGGDHFVLRRYPILNLPAWESWDSLAVPLDRSMKGLISGTVDFGDDYILFEMSDGTVMAWAYNKVMGVLTRDTAKDFTVDAGAWLTWNPVGQNTKTLTNKVLTSNVVTLTTSSAHGFAVDDWITISGTGSPVFDGTYQITAVPDSTHFSYARVNANVSSGVATGRASLEAGLYSSRGDGKLSRYSNYYPSAGEKWWAQYADTGAAGTHTAPSPESAGLAVPARRFVTVALNPAPGGVTGADVYVGYGSASPGATKYRRAEPLTSRTMTLTKGKATAGTRLTRPITNKALTSNVATLTSTAHGFIVGEVVTVAGVDATFNGTYAVTAVTTNTFSYAKTAANVGSTAATGTASLTNTMGGAPGELWDDFGNSWKGSGVVDLPGLVQTLDSGRSILALASGYAEFSAAHTPEVRNIGKIINLIGLVKPSSGSFAAGTQVTVGTLAVGYRPEQDLYFALVTNGATNGGRLVITTAGLVQVQPGAAATFCSITTTFFTA